MYYLHQMYLQHAQNHIQDIQPLILACPQPLPYSRYSGDIGSVPRNIEKRVGTCEWLCTELIDYSSVLILNKSGMLGKSTDQGGIDCWRDSPCDRGDNARNP